MIVLKRDVKPEINGQRHGLELRFASVTRIRPHLQDAVLEVVWRQYSPRGRLHGIIAPGPHGREAVSG